MWALPLVNLAKMGLVAISRRAILQPVLSKRWTMNLPYCRSASLHKALERARNTWSFDNTDSPISAWTDVIRMAPDMAEAYCERASAYCWKGEANMAIADCNEAIRLDPNLSDAYNVRAQPTN